MVAHWSPKPVVEVRFLSFLEYGVFESLNCKAFLFLKECLLIAINKD